MKKTHAMTLAGLGFGAIADYGKKEFGSQGNIMKTVFALFLWVISTLNVSAQKSVVLDAFSKHGIDVKILNADNLRQPDNYSYELKQTTIAAGKETVIEAKFDPAGAKGEEWTVTAVNGKNPSKSDINSFRKNQGKESASNKADDASYKVEKETPGSLVISYKQDPAAIAKDAAFMKDCRFYMTINLGTKELEQVEALNEKPLKIKILNAEKFDLVQKYIMDDQAKRYFATNQNLNILAKFLGQAVNVQTITEYSNYSKK
jgi:hypothetical protein